MSEVFRHPGAVDVHDHFREPSNSNLAENFESGTRAALTGGYVVVNDMPNTPGRETWTLDRLTEKENCIIEGAHIPTGIIIGMQPEADNIGEISKMMPRAVASKQYYTRTQGNDKELGPEDFREQTRVAYRADATKPIMVHPGEDIEGIIGMVAIDNNQRLHFCHVNDPQVVRDIDRIRRERDLSITMGVTPHHLFKNSADTFTEGWFARMQPPLADQVDSEELLELLADGTIDIVETDHAPHSLESKWKVEHSNPTCEHDGTSCFGVTNIEFALPMLFYQVRLGRLSMERVIDATSTRPAELIGIRLTNKTYVEWDLDHDYRINDRDVVSGSGWTPFQGKLAVGEVVDVVIAGRSLMSQEDDGVGWGRFAHVLRRGDAF